MYEVKKLETSKAMLTVRERESQQGQTTVLFQGRIFCASSPEWLRVGSWSLTRVSVFFYHLQLLKYSRTIALFDTFLMSRLQLKECCLGS